MDVTNREQTYLQALQNGDESAFEALYIRHYSNLIYFVQSYIPGIGDEARDIIADVFGHLWSNRHQITLQGSLKAYLYTSVRNKAVDYMRKHRIKHVALTDQVYDIPLQGGSTPEGTLMYKQTDAHIASLIERLPPQAKLIFKMNRDEGLTYEEVAQILGLSVNSVKTHMYRALKFIKEEFAAYSK